jgi:5S rRNA maturation endonuclease (ribonuclease M5)
VVEGEADACAALSAGYTAVVATPGASVPREVVTALQKLLARREVVLFPDPDEAGQHWLERVGRALANARCAVRFVPADDADLDARHRAVSRSRAGSASSSFSGTENNGTRACLFPQSAPAFSHQDSQPRVNSRYKTCVQCRLGTAAGH